jgi:hypothetical protein
MKRRELLTSKKAPSNQHFLHRKCQTPVEFDTLRSGLFASAIVAYPSRYVQVAKINVVLASN